MTPLLGIYSGIGKVVCNQHKSTRQWCYLKQIRLTVNYIHNKQWMLIQMFPSKLRVDKIKIKFEKKEKKKKHYRMNYLGTVRKCLKKLLLKNKFFCLFLTIL